MSVGGIPESTKAHTPGMISATTTTHGKPPQKIETMAEWLTTVGDCLTDRGWAVEVDVVEYGIGNYEVVGDEQGKLYQEDYSECEVLAGRAPNDVDVTPEWIGRYYDYLVTMKTCLTDLGFSISDPTTKAQFQDDYLTGEIWSPFFDLPEDLTKEELREIHLKCPENFT